MLSILLTFSCQRPPVEPGMADLLRERPERLRLTADRPRVAERWQQVQLQRSGQLLVGELPYHDLFDRFYYGRQPRGLFLERTLARSLTYGKHAPQSWWVEDGRIYFRPGDVEVPGVVRVRSTQAIEAARELDPHGVEDVEAFTHRTMVPTDTSLTGLFLPAPAEATWQLELPRDARFTADFEAVQGPIRVHTPGRVEVTVQVSEAGETVSSARCRLRDGSGCTLDLDLSRWEGRTVELTIQTRATGKVRDVLVHAPSVYTPVDEPRRVVMLFADTFRFDRLGVFGAERKTPNLDRWANWAARFTQARSVSSWTVPSVRAVRSGKQPEEWDDDATRLAEIFRDAGYYTAGFANNAFLASHGDMGRGFDRYRYEFKAGADTQIDEALAVLDRHPDRDVFLSVQFMDTHLPYQEPAPFRTMYVGQTRGPSDRRSEILGIEDPAQRRYVEDRYDQNVQFIDHHVQRLLARLKPDDIVLFFSDHGEELWEHDGFEHGHALWEEVVHVPLIIAAPGVKAATIETPVSLLDIAPTVLELAGLPPIADADGTSLVPLLHQDAALDQTLRARDQLIGRTLWGADAWGLLRDDEKLIAQWDRFDRYDLGEDPDEAHPTALDGAQAAEARERMEAQHGHAFVEAIAIRHPDRKVNGGGRVRVQLDGDVSGAWTGYRTPKVEPTIAEGVVDIAGRHALPGQVYILPADGVDSVQRLEVQVVRGGRSQTVTWQRDQGELAFDVGSGADRFQVMVDTVPAPGGIEIPVTAEGLEDQLEALGYAE